ncbi:MAG: DUF3861 domain-containing protein [Sphingobium sp.]
MSYRYRITVEKLDQPEGEAPLCRAFDVTNHDDLIPLIDQMRGQGTLPEAEVAEFIIGLKLFGGVHMRHRREPLFAPLHAPFLDFMQRLKGNAPAADAQG